MDDLIAFLRVRLDEDEQAARRAMWHEDAGTWRTEPTPYETQGAAQRWYIEDSLEDGVVSHVDPQASDAEGVARHIARHDPARVLREVAAKRRIVDTYTEVDVHPNRLVYGFMQQQWVVLRAVIAGLALPYSDHEDYREEWRP